MIAIGAIATSVSPARMCSIVSAIPSSPRAGRCVASISNSRVSSIPTCDAVPIPVEPYLIEPRSGASDRDEPGEGRDSNVASRDEDVRLVRERHDRSEVLWWIVWEIEREPRRVRVWLVLRSTVLHPLRNL